MTKYRADSLSFIKLLVDWAFFRCYSIVHATCFGFGFCLSNIISKYNFPYMKEGFQNII